MTAVATKPERSATIRARLLWCRRLVELYRTVAFFSRSAAEARGLGLRDFVAICEDRRNATDIAFWNHAAKGIPIRGVKSAELFDHARRYLAAYDDGGEG